jgi:hypothetical protein
MITPIPITPAIIKMVHRIAEKDGMPKGLKITNHTGQVLYDSTWIAGVDYDEDKFEDKDYDSNSDKDEDSKDSNDDNFAYVSFSVFVCPSVLTMSFLAPCADSGYPPGRLTCHAVLLSLLKKSGKVLVTLFPRFPPPWPTPLRRRVFDVIKIAMSLMVYFLQRQFHHRWQNHGAVFLMKIEPESPRSSAGVLSLNTPAVPHQIQAIILKNCSSRSRLSLFQHGHPNRWSWSTMTGKSVWQWTISNPHLLMMTPSESTPGACVQACNPLKLSSCCKYKVYYTYISESFL